METIKSKRGTQTKWYFGGLSSTLAISATHPLDLTKVLLQTSQGSGRGILSIMMSVFRSDGILGLYNGLSASILRQLTYSFPRFGFHDFYKNTVTKTRPIPMYENIFAAGIGGLIGGITGNPADMVNVRMQNDMKLESSMRRNYKHAFHGVVQIVKHEGFLKLFSGVSMNANRAMLMTIGQAAGYDQCKMLILSTGYFRDNPTTHLCSAMGAAAIATFLTQPFDVMKTRLMSAKKGRYNGLLSCAKDIMFNGPLGFFKGLTPSFIRIGPHTVLLFIIKEQLVKHCGRTD